MITRLCLLLLLTCIGCTTAPPKGSNRFLVETHWIRNTLAKEHAGSRRQHRFAPILTQDLIIQANSIDGIVAYDRKLVQPKWRLSLREGVEGGAIVAGQDLLFGASDGFFYAVNAATGEVRWTYPLRSEGLSVPYAEGGTVYFVSGNNVLTALEIATGKMLWVYTRRDPSMISIRGGSQPKVVGDMLYVGFSDGFLVALKASSGALVWEVPLNRNKRFRDVDAHPVVVDDRIYVSSYDGALYCLNRADGRVIWNYEDGGDSTVTVQNDRLYYSTSSGKVIAIDRASGKPIWTHQNASGVSVEPILYKEIVIAGEMNGPLNFLDQRTGAIVGQFEPGWGVTSRAVLDEKLNEVYFMSAGANLYALGMNWKRWTRTWPWE